MTTEKKVIPAAALWREIARAARDAGIRTEDIRPRFTVFDPVAGHQLSVSSDFDVTVRRLRRFGGENAHVRCEITDVRTLDCPVWVRVCDSITDY